jgi:hypothetical protein
MENWHPIPWKQVGNEEANSYTQSREFPYQKIPESNLQTRTSRIPTLESHAKEKYVSDKTDNTVSKASGSQRQITHKTIASWNCYSLNLYKYTNQIPRPELVMNSTNPTNESRTPESRHHNVLQPAKLEFSNAYSRRTRKKTCTHNKSTNPQAQVYFSLLSPAALELLAASNPILFLSFFNFHSSSWTCSPQTKVKPTHKPQINENRVFTERSEREKYTPSRIFAQMGIATLFSDMWRDAQLKTQRKRIHETRTRSNKLVVWQVKISTHIYHARNVLWLLVRSLTCARVFFFPTLISRWTGDHPQEEWTKFG